MPTYMRIVTKDGLPLIKGDVTAPGYEKWIEVSSVSFPNGRATSFGSGGGTQQPKFTELRITKTRDSASTYLALAAQRGDWDEAKVQIAFVSANKGNADRYMDIVLQDAFLSAFSIGNGANGPVEAITISFSKITFDSFGNGPDVSSRLGAMGWATYLGQKSP
jgi:type VI secretion system secreted protein Hcp